MHHIVRSSKRHRVFSSVIFLSFPWFFVKSEPPNLLQRQPSRNSWRLLGVTFAGLSEHKLPAADLYPFDIFAIMHLSLRIERLPAEDFRTSWILFVLYWEDGIVVRSRLDKQYKQIRSLSHLFLTYLKPHCKLAMWLPWQTEWRS